MSEGIVEAARRLAQFLAELGKPDLDDAIAIKDALGERLDLAYVRRQADAAGPAVRRRLDLMFPA